MNKRAFTLIELLVVIAIISILATMLMPALRQAQDLTRTVVCTNNLKSLGLQLQYYLDEYQQKLPPGYCHSTKEWYLANMNQIAGAQIYDSSGQGNHIWRCPTDEYSTVSNYRLSYRANYTFFRWCSTPYYYNYNDITRPSNSFGFVEAQTNRDGQVWQTYVVPSQALDPILGVDKVHNDNKSSNYLWFDWHVTTLDTVPDPNDINSGWHNVP